MDNGKENGNYYNGLGLGLVSGLGNPWDDSNCQMSSLQGADIHFVVAPGDDQHFRLLLPGAVLACGRQHGNTTKGGKP